MLYEFISALSEPSENNNFDETLLDELNELNDMLVFAKEHSEYFPPLEGINSQDIAAAFLFLGTKINASHEDSPDICKRRATCEAVAFLSMPCGGYCVAIPVWETLVTMTSYCSTYRTAQIHATLKRELEELKQSCKKINS